ncbi:hypothetical protein HUJ04_001364, partial [Dendroctonus ponderosae]
MRLFQKKRHIARSSFIQTKQIHNTRNIYTREIANNAIEFAYKIAFMCYIGILVSKSDAGEAIVSSVPAANPIYSDVYTSVFNRSYLLPFFFVVHNNQQDAFYFIKKDSWKINDDKTQLKRLQGQVNTTFHEN